MTDQAHTSISARDTLARTTDRLAVAHVEYVEAAHEVSVAQQKLHYAMDVHRIAARKLGLEFKALRVALNLRPQAVAREHFGADIAALNAYLLFESNGVVGHSKIDYLVEWITERVESRYRDEGSPNTLERLADPRQP